ncbi:hypothetical protein VTK73DRAFT_4928 [Phialemonium thermophilum]|uniref:Xylanolytic transcriptional activator regulatory domain-containing protein n=1 Tax=Phialemonium thermophilum TaxID=223376 RepID=A0ABR3V4V3_9PEZI
MNPAPSGIMRSEGPGGILSSGRAAALRPNLSCQTGPAPASPSSSSLASSARVAASMSPGSAAWDGKFRLGTGLPSLGVDGRHHHHHHHQRPMSSGGSTAGGAALSPALAHPPPAGHVSSLLPAATGSPVAISADLSLLDDPQAFWRRCLLGVLPTRRQSDLLVDYFFEQFNWFYQAVHAPSFRAQYERFWSLSAADVDLTWLALLFVMLCLSSLYAPAQFAEAAGLDAGELSLLSKRYYAASRQALLAGGYDSKPTLTQIQVFVNTQLYWYGMKNIEALNSHLAMAVRNAQAMGLDKESPPSITDCLEREMRHRLWWDLVSSDT